MPMLQLILAMIIWGTLGLFVLKSGLSSINIAFFRCLIGAFILAPYCWYKGFFSRYYFKKEIFIPIVFGGILVVLNWILLFESFKNVSITLGNVSYYMQPVFLLILARFFFKESIPIIKWIFASITLIGVLLTIDLSSNTLQVNHTELYGVFCALLAGFFYSIATMIAKKVKDVAAPMITFLQLFIGVLILLPFSTLTKLHLNGTVFTYIITLGIVHTVLAFILYYQSVTQLSIDKIAVISYIDPIAAIFTDILFFNRVLLPIQIAGIILTLAGSYFVIDTSAIKRLFKVVKWPELWPVKERSRSQV